LSSSSQGKWCFVWLLSALKRDERTRSSTKLAYCSRRSLVTNVFVVEKTNTLSLGQSSLHFSCWLCRHFPFCYFFTNSIIAISNKNISRWWCCTLTTRDKHVYRSSTIYARGNRSMTRIARCSTKDVNWISQMRFTHGTCSWHWTQYTISRIDKNKTRNIRSI
jgi:hypothetical protein